MNKNQILVIFAVIIISVGFIQVYGISGTRIFNGEFQLLANNGKPIVRCLDSGMCVFNGITNNPDVYDTLHTQFSTSQTTYLSIGLGGFIEGKYQNPAYQSGIHVNADLFITNSVSNGGYQIAIYKSNIGIPSSNQPPNQDDLLLLETPVIFQSNIGGNYNSIPMQVVHVPTTNQTYYYYVAVRDAVQGTVTVASTSSINVQIN